MVAAELAASPPDGSWRILDVGGGTGGFAVPLAEAGFQVTVVDTSPNALAGLVRRATEAGVAESITAMQGDADALASLVEPDSVRLVLCHSVLEMVDSPTEVTKAIASVLQPGGAASILVANRAGAVLSRALGGNLTAAMTVLADAEGRSGERDTLLRRFDPDTLAGLMATANLEIHQMHGVNVSPTSSVVNPRPRGRCTISNWPSPPPRRIGTSRPACTFWSTRTHRAVRTGRRRPVRR